jgi:hypothetical protein
MKLRGRADLSDNFPEFARAEKVWFQYGNSKYEHKSDWLAREG